MDADWGEEAGEGPRSDTLRQFGLFYVVDFAAAADVDIITCCSDHTAHHQHGHVFLQSVAITNARGERRVETGISDRC